jgi:hypothetical protein
LLPVRKIPKNYRSVTGRIAKHRDGDSAGFESTLERDHYIVLSFDPLIAAFVEQPVEIAFTDASGKARTYTPDALERFIDGSRRLVKVKYVNEFVGSSAKRGTQRSSVLVERMRVPKAGPTMCSPNSRFAQPPWTMPVCCSSIGMKGTHRLAFLP